MRREMHRFTPSAGAPGKSGAVLLAGTPADVLNSAPLLPCSREIPLALPSRKSIANSNGSLRRLREPEIVVVHSMSPSAFCERIRIWSVNCRKLLKRRAELEARLLHSSVDILCLQETWLSEDVESISITGYSLIGRLDRVLGPKRGFGGVAIFARVSLVDIALVECIVAAERMWCVLHTNLGALLIGNWYRAPDESGTSIAILKAEIERLRGDFVGILLVGDVNVHHKRWLKHSHSNTELGERLWETCRDLGLKQLVSKPTRGEYLLDVVLTDVPNLCKTEVLPEISDHRVVNIDLDVGVSHSDPLPRVVWSLKSANWKQLRSDILNKDWRALFDDSDPDGSVQRFCEALLDSCDKNIPRRTIYTKIASHPWLDETCFAAVAAKSAAAGSSEFADKSKLCGEVLRNAFLEYRRKLRARILDLPRHSKEWWRLNKELLYRRAKASTIPPLKIAGELVLDAKKKANALARAFQAKSSLPQPVLGPKQELEKVEARMPEFILIRSRLVLRILKALKLDTASGPDGIPVRVYRECCSELAPAIAVLVRYLLRIGCWPQIWRLHRIQALFKKGAVSVPSNYRGVHLTNIVSKVVERAIASVLVPYFDRIGAFGSDQWAFRKQHSCKDLVALLVCRWLWALDNGFKVGIYLSDIAGAFDRVDRDILTEYLRQSGISQPMLRFLFSYLAPRAATVVVQGYESDSFTIEDEVFRRTVLGPPLWNIFFREIDDTIRRCLFRVAKFADDLTAYRNYVSSTCNSQILDDLKECQLASHQWGSTRRVSFDASKEHFCILHKLNGTGETFRLLGVLVTLS